MTTADSEPAPRPYPVRFVPRSLPVGVRHFCAAADRRRAGEEERRRLRDGDARADDARRAPLARTPFVAKLTQDPAFERALRRGHYRGSLADFQNERVGFTASLLRRARDLELHRAAHVICPSSFLAGLDRGLGRAARARLGARRTRRRRCRALPEWTPGERPTLAFAGRLTAPKDARGGARGGRGLRRRHPPARRRRRRARGARGQGRGARARLARRVPRRARPRRGARALPRAPTRRFSRRRGRTSRTRSSRRSRSGRP